MNSPFSRDFLEKMKKLLLGEKKQLEKEAEVLKKEDPFFKEAEGSSRNTDELGDDVQEQREREINDGMERDVEERKEEVEEALSRIEEGTYGLSIESGKPIEKERLEVDPAADLTADEARKREEKNRTQSQ